MRVGLAVTVASFVLGSIIFTDALWQNARAINAALKIQHIYVTVKKAYNVGDDGIQGSIITETSDGLMMASVPVRLNPSLAPRIDRLPQLEIEGVTFPVIEIPTRMEYVWQEEVVETKSDFRRKSGTLAQFDPKLPPRGGVVGLLVAIGAGLGVYMIITSSDSIDTLHVTAHADVAAKIEPHQLERCSKSEAMENPGITIMEWKKDGLVGRHVSVSSRLGGGRPDLVFGNKFQRSYLDETNPPLVPYRKTRRVELNSLVLSPVKIAVVTQAQFQAVDDSTRSSLKAIDSVRTWYVCAAWIGLLMLVGSISYFGEKIGKRQFP